MAKKRKRDTQPINTAYLGALIQEFYRCSKSQFAQKADVSRSTIYNALKGKPLDNWVIVQLCEKDSRIDRKQLTTILPNLQENEFEKETDASHTRPVILSLVSIRGGVGKTLLAVSIATELAAKCRVALVDVDLFTFGATRWFQPLLQTVESPLTFLDIALGTGNADSSKQVLSTEVEQPIVEESPGRLFFVPSHAPEASQGVAARPILVDWTVDDAQDAIELLIARLSSLDVDVIILDTHPGLMALTDVVCKEADCNILVSDCDASTLEANWLLAWEIQSRQQHKDSKIPAGEESAWRIAINRIPSPKTVADCHELVDEARQSARNCWPNKGWEPGSLSESTEPVLLLAELEAMRLDELETYSPTSIKRRGGNRTVMATKYLVRRLGLEKILPEIETVFPYANAENQVAHEKLSTYIENYGSPWNPGWRRFGTRVTVSLAIIFVLFLIHYATWRTSPSDWYEHPTRRFILGATSGSTVCLVVLILSGIVREVIGDCRSICWFVDACSIGEYPAEQQRQIYDAGVHPGLMFAERSFSLFVLLVAIVPTTGFAGILYPHFGPIWKTALHGAVALIVVLTLWSTPGKSSVLRVLWLGFSSFIQRIIHRFKRSHAQTPATPDK